MIKILLLVSIITLLPTASLPSSPDGDPDLFFQSLRSMRSMEFQIDHLGELLQSLSENTLDHFVHVFHMRGEVTAELAECRNGAYFYYVGKMYLYGMFESPHREELRIYKTKARYLAAYFYLKVASQRYGNREAYYLLGLLEQFKLVPDKVVEGNLESLVRDKHQEILYRYLKTSHLNNGEHMLYMSAAMGYDPAALVMGHMNRQPFGTTYNCTTALSYYLAVLKRSLSEPYVPKLVFEVYDSLEDELFAKRRLEGEQIQSNQFVVETTYFDEETISATLEQANRYYTGSGGVLRDLPRALRLYEKLSLQDSSDAKIMAALMYFRGEGTLRNVNRAKTLFQEAGKDEIAEYMLLTMDYFDMFGKTKDKALLAMKRTADAM